MIKKFFKNNSDFQKIKIDIVNTGEHTSISSELIK